MVVEEPVATYGIVSVANGRDHTPLPVTTRVKSVSWLPIATWSVSVADRFSALRPNAEACQARPELQELALANATFCLDGWREHLAAPHCPCHVSAATLATLTAFASS